MRQICLFFGSQETREISAQIKASTNNEEIDISLKSKAGKLKITKESIGQYIDYVREVGGRYSLKFSRNGVKQTINSSIDTAKIHLERNLDHYSKESFKKLENRLGLFNLLKNRTDEKE